MLWVLGTLLAAAGLIALNAAMMHATFVRGTPVVSFSTVYFDDCIGIYCQVSGPVHRVRVIEIVMNTQQIRRAGATGPRGFVMVPTNEPLRPEDQFVIWPWQTLPLRDLTGPGDYLLSGRGHFSLWCGRFHLPRGRVSVLRIPCQRSLDESPCLGIRYRYRVGLLEAEEYRGAEN
jgi:hypothetical protein